MRIAQLIPGVRPANDLVGGVLARDLVVAGSRWPKGRRLSPLDLELLMSPDTVIDARRGLDLRGLTVLIPDADDVHEDEAALRLAGLVAGDGLSRRGPAESRVDLLAAVDGVVHVRIGRLERLNRLDMVDVFTVYDGQTVRIGELVASAKIAPHLVPAAVLERAAALVGPRGLVDVTPFVARRVVAIVKESVHPPARQRFEASVRLKVEALGSRLVDVVYVDDSTDAVAQALADAGRRADLILTAGSASTDPADAFFGAIEHLGGRVVRHGVPAHPGSMLWLARIGRVDILGLPTCGAYSKATAADLILPRLLTGERVSRALVAGLGHGGVLSHEMRFRFPDYARDLDAPDG
ncbi:MAG TPA: molybdopterin-binding protein [Candidatus Limnocylindrales bacterium]